MYSSSWNNIYKVFYILVKRCGRALRVTVSMCDGTLRWLQQLDCIIFRPATSHAKIKPCARFLSLAKVCGYVMSLIKLPFLLNCVYIITGLHGTWGFMSNLHVHSAKLLKSCHFASWLTKNRFLNTCALCVEDKAKCSLRTDRNMILLHILRLIWAF